MSMQNTKYMNAKAFYEAHKDIAEITYVWFLARLKAIYQDQGDSKEIFRTGWYYFIDATEPVFMEMLKRGNPGRLADGEVEIGDLIKD